MLLRCRDLRDRGLITLDCIDDFPDDSLLWAPLRHNTHTPRIIGWGRQIAATKMLSLDFMTLDIAAPREMPKIYFACDFRYHCIITI